MRVGEAADIMDRVDGLPVRKGPALLLCKAVKAGRQDAHQAPVAVVRFVISAAFLCFVVFPVAVDGLDGAPSDIEGPTVWGEGPVIEPFHKVAHDLVQVDRPSAPDAFQQCQGQAAVICPGAFRKVEGAVTAHAQNRMPGHFFPCFKLDRAAEGIPDHNAHDPIQPDIVRFRHTILSFYKNCRALPGMPCCKGQVPGGSCLRCSPARLFCFFCFFAPAPRRKQRFGPKPPARPSAPESGGPGSRPWLRGQKDSAVL